MVPAPMMQQAAPPVPVPAPEAPPVPPPMLQQAAAPPPAPMQETPAVPPPKPPAPAPAVAPPAPAPAVPPPAPAPAVAPPAPAPAVPPPVPAFETVRFAVPEGVSSGAKLSVTAPSGRAVTVFVPPGAVAGQMMQAKVPVSNVPAKVPTPQAAAKRPLTDEEIAAKEAATLAKRAKKEEEEAKRQAREQKKAEKEAKAAEKEAKAAEKAEARAAKAAKKEAKANMPKKPKSSYLIFAEEARDVIKAEQPELSMTGLAKVMGERWRALSEEVRQGYVAKHVVDRERYEAEMKAAGLPLVAPKEPKPRKEPKEKKVKKQPARKRKKGPATDGDDDEEEEMEEEEEEEEGEEEEEIAWYVPEGYTVQEAAPTAGELDFAAEEAAEGDVLLGRRLLYRWEGVGWCEGVVEERNRDERFKLGGDFVNFWVSTHAQRTHGHARTANTRTANTCTPTHARSCTPLRTPPRCTTSWTRICRGTCWSWRTTRLGRTHPPTRGCSSPRSKATRPRRARSAR